MPITIRTLIDGRDRPVTIGSTAKVKDALEAMLRHDFTQLPVVDDGDKVIGVITSDSVIRALSAFGASPEHLQVRDAMQQITVYDPDDDITELLDDLRGVYAAVVVDSDKQLIAIVTGFDIAEHLRRQFEDLMLVQDIETAIKENIQYAVSRLQLPPDQIDAAIRRIGDPEDRVRKKVEEAIKLYLDRTGRGEMDGDAVSTAVAVVSGKSSGFVDFERLTLVQYCELLLSDQYWRALEPIHGGMHSSAMRNLLNGVRKSRNVLAHFRGQLSAHERSQLRVCAEWFAQHPLPSSVITPLPPRDLGTVADASRVVPADESSERQGRYAKLVDWLLKRPDSEATVTVTFDEIEVIIESPLPRSAFAHRSWWANDSVSHPQSLNWLDAGWRVAALNLTNRVVSFSRVEGRQGAYIAFFSAALSDLRARVKWGVAGQSPSGASWQLLAGMTREGKQLAILSWAFARRRRFRTELYIDCGDAPSNKRLFDSLRGNYVTIEARLGCSLVWERMDDRRASRIAMYSDGSIQDTPTELAGLREWALDAAIPMYDVFQEEMRVRS